MSDTIEDKKFVELNYKVVDDKTGDVLVTVDYPLGYVHGVNDVMSEEVTKHLYGKKVGDIIDVPIDTSLLYGERDESLVFTDNIENVPEEYREIGMTITMENEKGEPRSFIVTRFDDKTLTVDGNNPLCGRDVTFVLEVLSIREATDEEIDLGGAVDADPDLNDILELGRMKFSNTYILYPDNRALERAVASSLGMLSEELVEAATPDTQVTTADNFLHTRGNFEQRSFSTNIFESMREALEAALTEEYRTQDAASWAAKQNSLGNIHAGLGQLQRDEISYEKAIQCFKNALEVFNQEELPLEWATTQYNLATACQALGRMLDDAKPLKNAIDAYTKALLVWTRDESPEDWMFTMHQLGATFHAYGKLLKGNRNFQKSVVAYKNALAVLDADNYPLELTATHNNRAAVLHHLAESEENPERLIEAIKSYEKALTVCMEQQRPFHLAVIIRVNKATAQNVLAEITNDAELAEEVADEFELILECFPNALQPLCLKHCEDQMSKAKSLARANSVSG